MVMKNLVFIGIFTIDGHEMLDFIESFTHEHRTHLANTSTDRNGHTAQNTTLHRTQNTQDTHTHRPHHQHTHTEHTPYCFLKGVLSVVQGRVFFEWTQKGFFECRTRKGFFRVEIRGFFRVWCQSQPWVPLHGCICICTCICLCICI